MKMEIFRIILSFIFSAFLIVTTVIVGKTAAEMGGPLGMLCVPLLLFAGFSIYRLYEDHLAG